MTIRLGDLLDLPDALANRLKMAASSKADAMAGDILFRITGKRIGDTLSSMNLDTNMNINDNLLTDSYSDLGSYSGLSNYHEKLPLSQGSAGMYHFIDSYKKDK